MKLFAGSISSSWLPRAALILAACLTLTVRAQDAVEQEEEVETCSTSLDIKCGVGEECVEGSCQCMDYCHWYWGHSPQICTDHGITYQNLCELRRHQCYCRSKDARCGSGPDTDKPGEDVAIMYYTACQSFPCKMDTDQEKASFARRLAQWFYSLLQNKFSYTDESSNDQSLLRPVTDKTRNVAARLFRRIPRKGALPAPLLSYWFCEMDRDNSNVLKTQETSRLTQLLLPNNPCISQFIEKAGDSSGNIDADAWFRQFNIAAEDQVECSVFK